MEKEFKIKEPTDTIVLDWNWISKKFDKLLLFMSLLTLSPVMENCSRKIEATLQISARNNKSVVQMRNDQNETINQKLDLQGAIRLILDEMGQNGDKYVNYFKGSLDLYREDTENGGAIPENYDFKPVTLLAIRYYKIYEFYEKSRGEFNIYRKKEQCEKAFTKVCSAFSDIFLSLDKMWKEDVPYFTKQGDFIALNVVLMQIRSLRFVVMPPGFCGENMAKQIGYCLLGEGLMGM